MIGRCRWCKGATTVAGECLSGCEREPVYRRDCVWCGVAFPTGNKWDASCPSCDEASMAAYRAEHADAPPTAYTRRRTREGHVH